MGRFRLPMPMRVRKFVGMIAILAIMIVYAFLSMIIAVGHLQNSPHIVQALYFLIAGMAWALPVMPVIRWMQRPDPGQD